MSATPLVLEMKGNSLDDGPGIRTVVFMKGCPLDCVWCHNPESKKTGPELSFDPKECIGCSACIDACDCNAIAKANDFYIDRNKCTLCFDCADVCPSGAMAKTGNEISIDQIVAEALKDKPFYDTSKGGVTLSGGEPSLYMDYCSDILRNLKTEGIHTLIETCGQFDYKRFSEKILPFADMIYFDIKFIDADKHKKFCGITNEKILENFSLLYSESQKGGFTVLPRTPLVPEITATEDNLEAISDFLKQNNVTKAQLMAYNPLWHDKNYKIGTVNFESEKDIMQKWMPKETITACEDIFTGKGIRLI